MYIVVSNNETSTYKLNCVVYFKNFLLVGVRYITYGGFFQTKVYKISGCYSVRMTKNKKLISCENSMISIPPRS